MVIDKNPKSELALNFPFVAQGWAKANEVRAKDVADFIKQKSTIIGVGRMAMLLLLRA